MLGEQFGPDALKLSHGSQALGVFFFGSGRDHNLLVLGQCLLVIRFEFERPFDDALHVVGDRKMPSGGRMRNPVT